MEEKFSTNKADLIFYNKEEYGDNANNIYPDYIVLGSPFNITEEQWAGIVDEYYDGFVGKYKDYLDGNLIDYKSPICYILAKDSGLSLLNHLRVYKENTLDNAYGHRLKHIEKLTQWQQAQERVSTNWILLVKYKWKYKI